MGNNWFIITYYLPGQLGDETMHKYCNERNIVVTVWAAWLAACNRQH